MQPVTKFKTHFVKMTRDPAKHAENLEKVLNQISSEGWEITRFDNDMKKGTLIIAHRVEMPEAPVASPPGMPPGMTVVPISLASLFGGGANPDGYRGMSRASKEVINQVFAKMDELPKESEEARLQGAVESVCRKYPSPVLKTAATELKAHAAHHRKHAHNGTEEKCESSEQLEAIAQALEKKVAQSVV